MRAYNDSGRIVEQMIFNLQEYFSCRFFLGINDLFLANNFFNQENMKLKHIGLNIVDFDELTSFYETVLGFRKINGFTLPAALSEEIFDIAEQTDAFLYEKDDITLELFVKPSAGNTGYNHLCIEVDNVLEIVEKCNDKGYKAIRKIRDNKPDLVFVKDKSGNIFELKQKL